MELKGTIKLINETQTIGASGFRKRELVLITDEQYPQMIMIEFVQDKCDILNNYQVGQNVVVSINIRGREWINPEGVAKYFNSIQGWRIASESASNVEQFQPAPNLSANEPNGLPF